MFLSGYGCAGGTGAMSGGGENAQFGATAAMVAAATTAAMQDSQPFSQVPQPQPNYKLVIHKIANQRLVNTNNREATKSHKRGPLPIMQISHAESRRYVRHDSWLSVR